MDRQRNNIYPGAIVPQQQQQHQTHQQQQHQQQQQTQQASMILQSQPHSQHLILQQQQQIQNSSPVRKSTTPQAEYFDISRNQPSTAVTTIATTAYRSDVRELAYKLDMKRGSVEKWLRDKYNREHPNDKIMHPRGFKFTDAQRKVLMEFFERDRYPKPHDMELLAYELEVKKDQVKNWFHDQRRKHKRLEQLAMNNQTKKTKKSKYTKQQRKKLEEFFEKNFHPYPGDSRRLVNEFESRGSSNVQFRHHQGAPMRYDFGNLPNSRTSVQSRGFKFTEDQRLQLKEAFLKDKYPSTYDMERMARELGVRKVQIKNWFHDQRRKLKREGGG